MEVELAQYAELQHTLDTQSNHVIEENRENALWYLLLHTVFQWVSIRQLALPASRSSCPEACVWRGPHKANELATTPSDTVLYMKAWWREDVVGPRRNKSDTSHLWVIRVHLRGLHKVCRPYNMGESDCGVAQNSIVLSDNNFCYSRFSHVSPITWLDFNSSVSFSNGIAVTRTSVCKAVLPTIYCCGFHHIGELKFPTFSNEKWALVTIQWITRKSSVEKKEKNQIKNMQEIG